MSNSRIRGLIFAVIIIAVILSGLEGGARLLEAYVLKPPSTLPERPGWQTEYFRSMFDWHEPDPHLLWRFKANLNNPLIVTNSRHLLGPKIESHKPPYTYRVLILGDSSPVGLGLASRQLTFGERLRYLLEKHWSGRKTIEIVNAAVSGYSSEQMVRYLERHGWDYEPDLVVLYCGNNDASISGTWTDRDLLSAQRLVGLRSLLAHSSLYRVMRDIMLSGRSAPVGASRPLTVRMTPEQFGENLAAIAAACRRQETPLVVLSPPVPYLWPAGLQFKPFLHLGGQDGQVLLPPEMAEVLRRDIAYCLDRDRFRELYGAGDIFTEEVYRSAYNVTGSSDQTIANLTSQLERDSLDAAAWNNLGVSYWKAGEYEAAGKAFHTACRVFDQLHPGPSSPLIAAAASPILYNRGINLLSQENSIDKTGIDTAGLAFVYLDSALQCDYFSLRIKQPYRERIDILRDTPGVAVIDLPRIFYQNGGERLFVDHCHPTAEGHLLIARTIYDTIRNRL